jgi:hypothetical protein
VTLELDFGLGPLLLVAAEGIEPTSLDYRSNALPLSYTAEESPKDWLTRRGLNPHFTD